MKIANLSALGKPGIAGLGLLIFCISFYFGSIAPAEESLSSLAREESKYKSQLERAERLKTRKTAAPHTAMPQISDTPDFFRQLNAIASQYGLTIEHTSYRLTEKDGLRKIEVNLPVQGTYPGLRFYLRDILAVAPTLLLEDVGIQRNSSSEPLIEARIRLGYYLSTP